MSTIWTRSFWKAVAERGIKTFCQAAAAMLAANGLGVLEADWIGVLSASGMAALISVLTSIGSGAVGESGPSLGGGETLKPRG